MIAGEEWFGVPTVETLLIFTAASLLMNISPGPSNFYVMSCSIAHGWRAGAIAASGLALGSLVHVAAAAFGLAAVFHHFPFAYGVLKLLGAAYLVYLGIQHFRRAGRSPSSSQQPRGNLQARSGRRILAQSIVVEVSNPKTALFFLAFLPQFVDLSRGPPAPQILVLGCIVSLSAIPCDLLVAWLSGRAATAMSKSACVARIQEYLSGSILVGLGIYVARSERVV